MRDEYDDEGDHIGIHCLLEGSCTCTCAGRSTGCFLRRCESCSMIGAFFFLGCMISEPLSVGARLFLKCKPTRYVTSWSSYPEQPFLSSCFFSVETKLFNLSPKGLFCWRHSTYVRYVPKYFHNFYWTRFPSGDIPDTGLLKANRK
jgi:hypothetical protein